MKPTGHPLFLFLLIVSLHTPLLATILMHSEGGVAAKRDAWPPLCSALYSLPKKRDR